MRLLPVVLVLAQPEGTARAQPASPNRPVDLPVSRTEELAPLSEVGVLRTPPVQAAPSRLVSESGGPFRFAEPFAVEVTPATHGRWETADDGRTAVWRLRIASAGAVSLNLGFTRYAMPPGGRLFLHAPDAEEVLGPFAEADNESHGELWTPLVSGGELVVEVAVPAGRVGDLELRIGSVNRGFRDLAPADVVSRSHDGRCNIDVACSDADDWRDQVRSVGLIVLGGHVACSGVLLNNTSNDRTPYFLTARHCFVDEGNVALARTAVVHWNVQKPVCRGANQGSRDQFQTGAYFRATHGASDFALIELDDEPTAAHNVYYAGWDSSGASVASAVGIHHPMSHHKSINFSDGSLKPTDLGSTEENANGGYLLVSRWARGVMEPGSSGAPLYDQNGRVVAQYRGGYSFCGSPVNDWSGRLATSWTGGGTSATRLSDWLDPGGTGERFVDGLHRNRPPSAAGVLDDKALRLAEGETPDPLAVDVSYGFLDPEGDAMTYEASSSDATVATASASGSTVTLAAVSTGTVTVTVTATDAGGSNESTEQEFEVVVGANRSPETVAALSRVSLRVQDGSHPVEVSGAFEDADGDDLTYGASSSDAAVATATAAESTVTVAPLQGGVATVTVTATDASGSGTSARRSFEVVVNRGPVAHGTLPSLRLAADNEAVEVSGGFLDPDGDDLTYAAESSDPSVATVSVSGSTVTVTPVLPGMATITVTATDETGSNASATQTFAVTVENRSPVAVGSLPAVERRVADGVVTVEVSGAFRDPDGDALTYAATVVPADGSVVSVSVSGSRVTLTPENQGTATVTVTARDAGGSNTTAEQTFTVTVGGNRSPEAVGTLDALSLRVRRAATVDVSTAFRDRDDDPLTYGASSSDVSVATVMVSGSVVTVTAVSRGSVTVTVTATDVAGSNTTATQRFGVNVDEGGGGGGGGGRRNRAPQAVGTLADRTLEVGESLRLDLSAAFRDADGDVLTYRAASSAADVAAVTVSAGGGTVDPPGGVAMVTGLSAGVAEVTLTATDAEGSNRSAAQMFTVTVACAYTLTPRRRDVLWPAGTVEVTVTTGSTCEWEAASESGFLVITAGASGRGAGVVTCAVAANGAGPRTGALRVAGQRVTVYQASATAFTDDPVQRGVTPVRAIHFLELRARIDALRTGAGLAPFSWTDPVLAPGVTPVRAVHLTELQAALAEAYAAVGRPAPTYTDLSAPGDAVIAAAHLTELRDAVLALGT